MRRLLILAAGAALLAGVVLSEVCRALLLGWVLFLARVLPREEAERRAGARRRCPHRPALHLLTQPAFEGLDAEVVDVSRDGVGLLAGRALAAGSRVAFVPPAAGPSGARAVVAEVRHAVPRGPGRWQVGCRLASPLSEEELRGFLP